MLIIGGGLGVLVEGLAIEASDAIPSRLLRHVQRVVRSFHEGVTVIDARMGPCRHAAAHRALQRTAIESERVSLYCFTHALGEGNGRVEHSSRQQEHKLFSPIPADAVDLARLFFQDAGELLQYHIAHLMAVGVVHALEAIQITHHHCQRLLEPPRVTEHFLQTLLQVTPIVESRQRIGLRHLEETCVDFGQLALSLLQCVLESLDAQHRFHARFELGEVDRLRDVVVGTGVQSLDLVLGRIQRGLQDDRDERELLVRFDAPHDFEAIDARHHHVEQDQIGRGACYGMKRLLAIHRAIDGVPSRLQARPQQLDVVFVIVDDQNACG